MGRIIGIIGIIRIRVIRIGESEPDEDRIRPEKTVIGEKAIIWEKLAVSSKRATAESIILPKSEAAESPKFMPKTSTRPHPYVTAKSPRGDRQSPKGAAATKKTQTFFIDANG